MPRLFSLIAILIGFAAPHGVRAAYVDFTTWTLIEDPASPFFSAGATSTQANLLASDGVVPPGTDIGYASVNGATVAASTSGNFFDPGSDFSVAIDYSITTTGNPAGLLALGFGIGEDQAGANSAGVILLTNNGAPLFNYGGVARVGDADQPAELLGLTATASGSLFIGYEAATGDITVGASQTPSASSATVSGKYSGIQNQWNDRGLMTSFFIRSDALPPLLPSGWSGGGTLDAVFSNLRVLEGNPTAVPEASHQALLGCLVVLSVVLHRRRLAEDCGSGIGTSDV
jgi:hypothetical protein